ncbi:unnamed protein product [Prunus armeniaca]
MDECSAEPPLKRKADVKFLRDEAVTLRAMDVAPLRKKLRLPFVVTKFSSKDVSYAEKTQVGTAPSSSTRVKHLIGADSKKIGGMRNVQDIQLVSY